MRQIMSDSRIIFTTYKRFISLIFIVKHYVKSYFENINYKNYKKYRIKNITLHKS